jgi:hypothetical protein
VQSLGIAGSTTATPGQVLTGRLWNGAIHNYSNEIAQTAAVAHSLTTAQSARLFALLNLTFADSVMAFYDAKYTYNFWRPVTAIREAANHGNPATLRAQPARRSLNIKYLLTKTSKLSGTPKYPIIPQ